MSKRYVAGLAAVLFLAGSLLAGGTVDNNSGYTHSGDKAVAGKSAHKQCPVEKLAASCLLLNSQEGILVSQYAAGRVQSPEVKQYVRLVTADRTQLAGQLRRFSPQSPNIEAFSQLVADVCSGRDNRAAFTGQRAVGSNASRNVPYESATRVERPSLPGDQPSSNSSGGWNNEQSSTPSTGNNPFTGNNSGMHGDASMSKGSGAKSTTWQTVSDIQRRAAAYCVCLTKTELSQVPNNRFDRVFLSQQIGAQIGTIAHIRAVKPYVSGEFKTVLDSAEKTAQGHLDQANSILKNWSNQNSTASTYSSNN